MAKFRLPKLNSWVTPLVLASIGLHGLVLALPMPSLVEESPEIPEPPAPDVIQVVTLPKLAKARDSSEPPLPEPPQPIEEPAADSLLAEPAIVEPEIIEPEIVEEIIDPGSEEQAEWENDPAIEPGLDAEEENSIEPTLDQRIASVDSYTNYDSTRVGDGVAANRLGEIALQGGAWPSPLRDLEQVLAAVTVPLQDCLDEPPGTSVSFMVEVGPDGNLTGDPEPLNSAGYDVLDEKALEIAREADYAAFHLAGETKSYSFAIQIDYEACNVALTNTEASGQGRA